MCIRNKINDEMIIGFWQGCISRHLNPDAIHLRAGSINWYLMKLRAKVLQELLLSEPTTSWNPKGFQLRVSTKSTLSIVSILLKQNRFASAHLCGTRKQVFDLIKSRYEVWQVLKFPTGTPAAPRLSRGLHFTLRMACVLGLLHGRSEFCRGLKPQKTFPVFRTFPGYCG